MNDTAAKHVFGIAANLIGAHHPEAAAGLHAAADDPSLFDLIKQLIQAISATPITSAWDFFRVLVANLPLLVTIFSQVDIAKITETIKGLIASLTSLKALNAGGS